MKSFCINVCSLTIALLLGAMCIVFASPMMAGENTTYHAQEQVSLVGSISLSLLTEKDSYVEGEDVRLELEVTNLRDTITKIPVPSEAGVVMFHIEDERGKVVPFDLLDEPSRATISLPVDSGWKGILGLVIYSNDSHGTLAGALTKILAGEYTIQATMRGVTSNAVCIKIRKQLPAEQSALADIHQAFDIDVSHAVENGKELIKKYKESVYLPTIYSRLITKLRRSQDEKESTDELMTYAEEFMDAYPNLFSSIRTMEYYLWGLEQKNGITDHRTVTLVEWNQFQQEIESIKEKYKGKKAGEKIDELVELTKKSRYFYRTATIVGYVREYRTKEPLEGVRISVGGTTQEGITDGNGMYCITDVRTGSYQINVRAMGYGGENKKCNFSPGETVDVNFELKTDSEIWEERAWKDIREGNIRIVRHGIVYISNISPEEDRKITQKYGFEYAGGGCVIYPGEDAYNKIINKYLDKRNGKGWRKRMAKEFEWRKRQLVNDWE